MAAKKFKPGKKVITPKGVFVFPKLNKPDSYQDEAPAYKVKLRLSPEDSAAMIEKIEAEYAAYWPEAVRELEQRILEAKDGPSKAKARKALADMKEGSKGYRPAYGDDGLETGEFEFAFKLPASFKSKKTGVVTHVTPDICDSQGNEMKNPPEIWGGTTGHVAGEMRGYVMNGAVGISLRLRAVQIIELRSGPGDSSSGHGFGKVEGGFQADDAALSVGGPESDEHQPPNAGVSYDF